MQLVISLIKVHPHVNEKEWAIYWDKMYAMHLHTHTRCIKQFLDTFLARSLKNFHNRFPLALNKRCCSSWCWVVKFDKIATIRRKMCVMKLIYSHFPAIFIVNFSPRNSIIKSARLSPIFFLRSLFFLSWEENLRETRELLEEQRAKNLKNNDMNVRRLIVKKYEEKSICGSREIHKIKQVFTMKLNLWVKKFLHWRSFLKLILNFF